jgi:RNA-directed DNA polymerase
MLGLGKPGPSLFFSEVAPVGWWNWFLRLGAPLRAFWRWLREGRGFDVAELARRLGVPAEQLQSCRPDYRPRLIPKRSGGRRVLSIPSDELKSLQRLLLRRLLRRLRCHPAAKGFQPGESIVTNALPHTGQAVVVRLDLRNFFPATTAHRVDRYFRRIGWNRSAARLLTRLCTHRGGLPQGAPTSPRLSNLVNYRFDCRVAAVAAKLGARYTRYADDITLSFAEDERRRIRRLIHFVRRAAAEEGYRLHGRKKLRIRRRHEQQRVTGLVVNDGVRLPRRTRRWLRAVEHRLASGRPATLTPEQLAGWNALRHMIDRQAGAVAEPRAASTDSAPGQLQGAWVMEAIEHDGPAAPNSAAQEGPSPVVWVFGREELRVAQGGREGCASYRLDRSTEPHAITITPKAGPGAGHPILGIYLREADRLTICLGERSRGRPCAFTAESGSGQTVFRLRAVVGPPAEPTA